MFYSYRIFHCLSISLLLDICFQNFNIIKNAVMIIFVLKYLSVLLIILDKDKLLVVDLLVMKLLIF